MEMSRPGAVIMTFKQTNEKLSGYVRDARETVRCKTAPNYGIEMGMGWVDGRGMNWGGGGGGVWMDGWMDGVVSRVLLNSRPQEMGGVTI